MRRYVYAAGPITGHTFDEATDWRMKFDRKLAEASRYGALGQWAALSPMRAKDQFRMSGPLPSTFDEGKAAVMRDLNDIRRSDAVLINLAGAERVSIGTMAEMGYAYAERKFILVVMPTSDKVRRVGPPLRGYYPETDMLPPGELVRYEAVPNPHDHIFVHEMASQIVPTLDDALDVLLAL